MKLEKKKNQSTFSDIQATLTLSFPPPLWESGAPQMHKKPFQLFLLDLHEDTWHWR